MARSRDRVRYAAPVVPRIPLTALISIAATSRRDVFPRNRSASPAACLASETGRTRWRWTDSRRKRNPRASVVLRASIAHPRDRRASLDRDALAGAFLFVPRRSEYAGGRGLRYCCGSDASLFFFPFAPPPQRGNPFRDACFRTLFSRSRSIFCRFLSPPPPSLSALMSFMLASFERREYAGHNRSDVTL